MTARKAVTKALGLLGFSENDGNIQLTQRIMNRVLPFINLVYSDLRRICGMEYKAVETLSDEIELPEKAFDVFVCGLAGYIAGSEGDSEGQYIWKNEYQTRRVKLSHITAYKDTLPTVE